MPEGDEGDTLAPPPILAPPGGGSLVGSLVVANGGTINVPGGVGATVAGGVSELYETEQLLDCAYLGNRVRMRCPGAAQLQVYVAPVTVGPPPPAYPSEFHAVVPSPNLILPVSVSIPGSRASRIGFSDVQSAAVPPLSLMWAVDTLRPSPVDGQGPGRG